MDRFMMEVASELGVPLLTAANGNLISAQNGSVGRLYGRAMIEGPGARDGRWAKPLKKKDAVRRGFSSAVFFCIVLII